NHACSQGGGAVFGLAADKIKELGVAIFHIFVGAAEIERNRAQSLQRSQRNNSKRDTRGNRLHREARIESADGQRQGARHRRGRMKVVSERRISRATACICALVRPRASVKTASWLPSSGRRVKTSSLMNE